MVTCLQTVLFQGLQTHIAPTLEGKKSFNLSCKATLLPSYWLQSSLQHPLLHFLEILLALFLLSDCMSWILLLKTGKHLPGSFSQRLATIVTADECAETILRVINDHAPGARELVFPSLFFLQNYSYFLSLLYFKSCIFPFTYFKSFISFHGTPLRGGGGDGGGSSSGPVSSGET